MPIPNGRPARAAFASQLVQPHVGLESEGVCPRPNVGPENPGGAAGAVLQQHGLRVPDAGDRLRDAGYGVLPLPEGHLCCGSAGSYILQPEIAQELRSRKLANIRAVRPDVVATSNIGCLQHLSGPDAPPIVHIAGCWIGQKEGRCPWHSLALWKTEQIRHEFGGDRKLGCCAAGA